MGWLDGKQIVDALYGNSYDPLIQKIYKGDELIFERHMWDYEFGPYVYDSVSWDSRTGKFNNATYTGIKPFTAENKTRNWEIVFKASTTNIGKENNNTIGIISRVPNEEVSGYNTRWTLEIGIEAEYFYADSNLGGIDRYLAYPSNNKEIKIVKKTTIVSGALYDTISFYIDGEQVMYNGNPYVFSSRTNSNGPGPSEIVIGGCKLSGQYIFQGTLDYFKFRFTS